jgi:hypothetical protein
MDSSVDSGDLILILGAFAVVYLFSEDSIRIHWLVFRALRSTLEMCLPGSAGFGLACNEPLVSFLTSVGQWI